MSDFNNTISDGQLRDMLNRILLEADSKDSLSLQLTELEATVLFGHSPFVMPDAKKEQDFERRLQHHIKGFTHLKWFFIALASLGIIATFILTTPFHSDDHHQENKSVKNQIVLPVERPAETANLISGQKFPAKKQAAGKATAPHPMIEVKPVSDNLNWERLPQQEFNPEVNMQEPVTMDEDMNKGLNTILIDTFFEHVKRVEIHSLYFPVKVVPNATDKVTIKMAVDFDTNNKKWKRLGFKMKYEQKGDILIATVDISKKAKSGWLNTDKFYGEINFTLPPHTDLDVESKIGDLTLEGMNGKECTIQSTYGNIIAKNITTNVDVKSGAGDVHLSGIQGNVNANATYGNEVFSDLTGDLNASASSGNLRVNNLTGNATIDSKYGECKLSQVKGNILLSASSGDVTVNGMTGEKCSIKANYGRVNLQEVIGETEIEAKSGNVSIKNLTGNIKLNSIYGFQKLSHIHGNIICSSSSGDADLMNVQGDIKINATYGSVSLDECTGNFNVSAASGNIEATAVTIRDTGIVKTSYGSIRLKLKNDTADVSYDLETSYGTIRFLKSGSDFDSGKHHLVITKGKVFVKGYAQSGNIEVE